MLKMGGNVIMDQSEDIQVRLGVDIGGTFTDFSLVFPDGQRHTLKLPSTPRDPSEAVLAGLERLSQEHDFEPAAVDVMAHGSTVATNAVLERKGARLGLLTTKGFRDTLEIGRQMRRQMYSVRLDPETPVFLAPGRYRIGIPGRMGPDGREIEPLDETAVLKAVESLLEDGIETLAVAFLFAFLNPAHEDRVRQLVSSRWPDLPVSLSCEVDPAFREYERTVVTAFDAYIKPLINDYLARLESGIGDAGVPAPLQIMQSRGGLTGAAVARERPVRLFLSGPAAGVIGGRQEGEAAGIEQIITVDIGGTSCDIALISEAKPLLRQEGLIDGYSVRVPMVDVNAIGAGGGSIAWLDSAGGLRVGPQSTGSDPGPACYCKGGDKATVTDASVVLGLLDPTYFAGGDVNLDPDLAARAIETNIAGPLGLSVEDAALGIHRVLNAQMAEGIRLVSIRQGYDPRGFTLLALGGAGALHAALLAEELGAGRILIPRHPGVLSATGLLAAPTEHEVSASFARPLDDVGMDEVMAALQDLDRQAERLMSTEADAGAAHETVYSADVCYIGQSYHLEVAFDPDHARPIERLYDDFLIAHERVYGHAVNSPARIVNLRSVHRRHARALPVPAPVWDDAPAPGSRTILTENGRVEASVLRRAGLRPGDRVAGPAIIEQRDTTVWLPLRWRAAVLANGSLLATHDGESSP
jgi:N-methylhydantoinase A/oxoprolinase/acetone carboxylase beta subunit